MERYNELMKWDKNKLSEYILELERINRDIKEALTFFQK